MPPVSRTYSRNQPAASSELDPLSGSELSVVVPDRGPGRAIGRARELADRPRRGRCRTNPGQTGIFLGEYSADAMARGELRVLRFSDGDLERLRRRYPRIAARVLRNLNRMQAERVSTLTEYVVKREDESAFQSG